MKHVDESAFATKTIEIVQTSRRSKLHLRLWQMIQYWSGSKLGYGRMTEAQLRDIGIDPVQAEREKTLRAPLIR